MPWQLRCAASRKSYRETKARKKSLTRSRKDAKKAPEQGPARAALEALAPQGYRSRRLGESAVRRLLGFESRFQVHGFLKEHGVYLPYTMEDIERDTESTMGVALKARAEREASHSRSLAQARTLLDELLKRGNAIIKSNAILAEVSKVLRYPRFQAVPNGSMRRTRSAAGTAL